MRSWQTTIAGLGAIAAGVVILLVQGTGIKTDSAAIAAGLIATGIGLIRASDHKPNGDQS